MAFTMTGLRAGGPRIALDLCIVSRGSPIHRCHRADPPLSLLTVANDIEGTREVRFADPTASDSLRRFIGPTRDINEHYFDIAYANAPVQCSVEDETCEVMKREMRFVPTMSKDEGNQYKYVMDVDGNGWSDRFHRLM